MLEYTDRQTDLPTAAEHMCSDTNNNVRSWRHPQNIQHTRQQAPRPDNCKAHQGATQTATLATGHIFRILLM